MEWIVYDLKGTPKRKVGYNRPMIDRAIEFIVERALDRPEPGGHRELEHVHGLLQIP